MWVYERLAKVARFPWNIRGTQLALGNEDIGQDYLGYWTSWQPDLSPRRLPSVAGLGHH